MTDPRVVLVTGASRGIGAHLARHFAERGDLVVGCSRSAVEPSHERITHVEADVAREDDVRALMRVIRDQHGRLDVAINNAGVASMSPALLAPADAVERIMRVNAIGTVLVCRESVRLMRRGGGGRIVNLTSVAVPLRLEGESLYAASKSAVETFTRIFAREVAPFGITCNAVGPTPIPTDLLRGVPQEKLDALVQRLAIKRLGRFEDVSHVIDFLAHPASGCVTGQVVYLGGA